jgi:sugar/nucleoside kinase (ribokinase family)
MHDICAYGIVSASTLYRLGHGYPAAEGYAEIEASYSMTGGEAANSSIVLSRLGAGVKLDGCRLGDDESGHRVRAILENYGIDCSRLAPQRNVRTVEEVVIASGATRTIFGTYIRLQEERAWNPPAAEDIRNAKVLCLDPFLDGASRAALDLAIEAKVPVVTVDCRHDDPIAHAASAIVIAGSFLREHYGDSGLDEVFDRYCEACAGLVVFTFGDRALWYREPGCERQVFEPYRIDPVDTAGGGDAFRAGIVFGVMQGWTAARSVEFAAATAAIVCTRSPGVLNAPSLDEVESFIRSRAG